MFFFKEFLWNLGGKVKRLQHGESSLVRELSVELIGNGKIKMAEMLVGEKLQKSRCVHVVVDLP
jgi:hypothetical protein